MVIVDASVAYKWYSPGEDLSREAVKILEDHISKTEVICTPNLLLYELANAWATKTKLPEKQSQLNLKSLQSSSIIFDEFSFELISKAIKFSKNYKVTVYDASYVVLAREKGCDLFTADSEFVEKVRLPFVKHLSDYSSSPKVN